MRVAALLALLLAGCTASPGAPASPAAPVPSAASAAPTADLSTPEPSPSPTATMVTSTVYTADDDEIAKLVRAGAAEAISISRRSTTWTRASWKASSCPLANGSPVSGRGSRRSPATSCTAPAVELFHDGLDQYDAIRKQFLAWRDWGAQGHAFPVAAPGQAVIAFEQAVVELDATCPA